MTVSAIDIIFLILILLSMVRCALRGFIKEFLSMTSLICGVLAAIFFYKKGAAFLRERFFANIRIIPEVLAFSLLFFAAFLAVKIVELMLKDVVDMIDLGGVDRFIGILLGFLEGLVVVLAALFVITVQPVFELEPVLRESVFAQLLVPLIQTQIPAGFPASGT
ncbi:MAG: CvpA family protein [Spirochaetaceae bacterium]|jgi:membrane protein required for colicin V production|nr:CvpA family protein [Spirochaetaceae bacterium]